MAFTESLGVFLADFGVSVSFSGSAAGMLGIEDAEGVLAMDSESFPGVQQKERTLLIRTDQKGALAPDMAITVNGTARTVIVVGPPPPGMLPADADGAFSLVTLR